MKRNPVYLAVSLILFVGWLAYLGTQAWQYRRPPIIVSRSQLLAARYDVGVFLSAGPDGKPSGSNLKVAEVLYSADAEGPKVDQPLEVTNLDECAGFAGAGSYVLPLLKRGNAYSVAAPPLDPGVSLLRSFPPTIYPLNDPVRKQFAELRAGAGP